MIDTPEEPTLAKIFALRPPSADALRADLQAAKGEIEQLLALERAPTPAEVASLRRKLVQPVDQAAELPTLATRVQKLSRYGKRIATGVPTIDKATRGGVPMGKRMVLVGAPGASKTGVALMIGRQLLALGAHVAIHAADEDLDSLLVRLGQAESLCREDLEEGNAWAIAKLGELLERDYERLLAVDQEEDGWTLDDTVDELLRRGQDGRPMLLIVDSIQTVSIRGGKSYRSKREEIDDVVRRIKSFSARGIFVVATSEMNRRGYGSKIATEQVEDLASAAESRSIEFAAHIMIALKTVKDHEDLVDLRIAKNRLGRKLKWRMQINFDRATLTEVTPEEEPTAEGEKAKELSRKAHRVSKLADEIFEALIKQRAPVQNADQFRALVKGNSDEKRLAVAQLKNEGRIAWEKGAGRTGRWRAITSSNQGASIVTLPIPTQSLPKSTPTTPQTIPTPPTHTLYEVKGRGVGLGNPSMAPDEADPTQASADPTQSLPIPTQRDDESEDPS